MKHGELNSDKSFNKHPPGPPDSYSLEDLGGAGDEQERASQGRSV